ncbi:hypothetical protein LTR35_018091 [Friedmanniomyces endolithicus]|nr:hypothetical protein LTR35_018091 [Friedmanniomyces endolithicus]KAK0266050.1 hypothetical protein LTS00_017964 [Friedmanniomyces endolithicus]KAK0967066.1 hypothetical protein LTR54_018294 [Friedmanniomyces endolithicus]
MHRTDWAATFAGVEHRLLQTLGESPAWDGRGLELGHDGAKLLQSSEHDKTRLSRIGVAVDHSFDRGEDTARNTDHSMICWLLSQIPGRPHKALLYRLDGAACDDFLQGRLLNKQQRTIELLSTAACKRPSDTVKLWSVDQLATLDDEESDFAPEAGIASHTAAVTGGSTLQFRSHEGDNVPPSNSDHTINSAKLYEVSELSDDGETDTSFATS